MKRILNLFRSKPVPESAAFLPILKEYFAHIAPGKKDATLEKHIFFYNNIERFFELTGKLNMQLHEIKVKTMEEMRNWLHAERRRSVGHVSRHIEHCQAAFDYAVLMEYFHYNPIQVIKCRRDEEPVPVSLEYAELIKLKNHDFTSPKRKLVVDLFLFQCYTGLSYMDLWLYKIERDSYKDDNGRRVYFEVITSDTGRGKNMRKYSAQYNIHAKRIAQQYPDGFPPITNQGYNKILKKIAFALNINKELSTHNARKTYATLRYGQGMTLEGLADEMGNSPKILKKNYITESRDRIKTDIRNIGDTPFLSVG